MINKWILKPLSANDQQIIEKLAQDLGIGFTLAQLLIQRGINTFDSAKKFFRPQLKDLYDPFLMNDMDKAIDRLNEAMRSKEKILIYGDYDVDGTTSVALIYKFLQQYCSNLDYYIPDRYTEGYGISYTGIDFASENGFTLVIALDCGIKAVEKINYAKERGVDFIICDHHTPDAQLPNAVAVLDPKREDSTYPYSHLSGCGVGFKLLQAFAISNEIPFEKLIPLLDLLVVSIASDIVPITDENRIFAYHGLRQLNSNPSIGLQGILDICELRDKEITVSDIVFKIGPRINASGRIHSGKEAVDLLISKDSSFAKTKSTCINQYNQDRKSLDKKITEEAKEYIDEAYLASHKSIVVYDNTWSKGVIGIVASRLTEAHYRPTVVLTLSNNIITGSARSVPGFDIYKAVDSCRDLLENFGGHMYAAGLSLKEENLDEFKSRFEQYVSENITKEQQTPIIDMDTEIGFDRITPKFFRVLKQFNPFGPENMKPVFYSPNVFDYGGSRQVGRNMEHQKLELIDPKSGVVMNGIAFNNNTFNEYIKSGRPIDICYTIEENHFNGNTSIQLMIKDMRVSETIA